MPDFYVIIARKIFSRFWGGGHVHPLPTAPHLSPTHMLIVNFTNIIDSVCIVGKCPWVIDGHAADDVT